MRRQLTTLALAGLFGGLLLSSDASACHKKKACATPCETVVMAAPAPAPVCEAPAPAPVCEAPKAKKCHFKMPKMKLGHHKKAAACEVAAPVAYEHSYPTYASYPTHAAPQSYASPQSSHQGY